MFFAILALLWQAWMTKLANCLNKPMLLFEEIADLSYFLKSAIMIAEIRCFMNVP
jgi:hypothetical protein